MSVRVRFAPSPTGSPHVGNLRTAIFNWLFAKANNGVFIARLEDTDRSPDRYKPESVKELEDAMAYLGIIPDEGWAWGGEHGPYVQSERLARYQSMAEDLMTAGHAYRCFCTKEELEASREANPNQGYDGTCRNLSRTQVESALAENRPHVVRLMVPLKGTIHVDDLIRGRQSFDVKTIDDQVLLKSDGYPTYFLAAAVDDVDMRISHIIRGDDWLSSAAKLVLLWNVIGVKNPPKFVHLPLIVGPDKAKLAKRHGSTTFNEFIDGGFLPEALFNYLALLGWSTGSENKELMTVDEMVERFSLDNIQKSPAMFDYEKLRSFNGHYIRNTSVDRLFELTKNIIPYTHLIPDERIKGAIALEQEKARTLQEFKELTHPLMFHPIYDREVFRDKFVPRPPELIQEVIGRLKELANWTPEDIEELLRAYALEKGYKFGQVIHPMRIAIFGKMDGPSLMHSMELIGRAETLHRLDVADREPLFASTGASK